jgi:hypothetical protein
MSDAVWTDITMYFIEGFPKVGGKSVVLTVIDRFSKYGHFIALGHPYSVTTVTTAFFTNIIRLHRFLALIVSDRDPVFTSRVWQEMFKLSGTQLCLSSAFRPQTDGQSEVTNHVIVMYLRCLAGDWSWSWLRRLPWAEYYFNTSYQTALRTTPFQVVYGRPPLPMVPFQSGATKVLAMDRQLRDRDTFLVEIYERLLQAHARMKMAHYKGHCHVEFAPGDLVWLLLNQRATASVRDNARTKLALKFFGPYEVIERIGPVAYKLRLPAKARIHNVFHVAFLKKFEGSAPQNTLPLPHIVRGRAVPTPRKVARAHTTKDSWELLVQWHGRSAADATWEPLQDFKDDYPEFQFKDELFRQTGGSVVDTFFNKQYSRRKKKASEAN